jgi:hypothetical protein
VSVIRHVVLFRLRPELSPDRRAEFLSAVASLPDEIPSVLGHSSGPNLWLQQDGWDVALLLDFADEDGFLAYKAHAAHRRFIEEQARSCIAETARAQIAVEAASAG